MVKDASVIFQFGTKIETIETTGDYITGVICDGESLVSDQYIVAMESYSTNMLQNLVNILVYSTKGYSLTMPIIDQARSPVSTVLDESYKIAITRFDDRIRVGGMEEIVDCNLNVKLNRCETLKMVVQDLYKGGGDIEHTMFWTGLRAMTPDGTPIVGPTPYHNLYLNTGHGTLGWTMAYGSGKLLTYIMSNHENDIAADDLSVFRYLNS